MKIVKANGVIVQNDLKDMLDKAEVLVKRMWEVNPINAEPSRLQRVVLDYFEQNGMKIKFHEHFAIGINGIHKDATRIATNGTLEYLTSL